MPSYRMKEAKLGYRVGQIVVAPTGDLGPLAECVEPVVVTMVSTPDVMRVMAGPKAKPTPSTLPSGPPPLQTPSTLADPVPVQDEIKLPELPSIAPFEKPVEKVEKPSKPVAPKIIPTAPKG